MNNNNDALIKLENFTKSFFTSDMQTQALSELELSINKGDYVCITGPSGCGKSTLLSLLGLLDTSTSGNYWLNGHNVVDLSSDQRAKVRNKEIGFIFQSFNLISDLTVAENLCVPQSYDKDNKKSLDEAKEVAKQMLDIVEMGHRMNHFPNQLSGGQQQRVAIARALVNNPSVLLADEPTGNLDSKNAEIVLDILTGLHKKGTTIVMVTHDPRLINKGTRHVEIFDGKVVKNVEVHPVSSVVGA